MAIQFGEGSKMLNLVLTDGTMLIHPRIERVGTALYYIFSGKLEKVGEFENETLGEVIHTLRQTLDWDTRRAAIEAQAASKTEKPRRKRNKIERKAN